MQRTARIVDTYISLELDLLSFLAEKCKADLSCKSWDGSNLLVRHVVLEKKDKVVIGEEAIKSKQEVLWFQGPFSFWKCVVWQLTKGIHFEDVGKINCYFPQVSKLQNVVNK